MRIQTISVRFLKNNKHLLNYVCKFIVYKYAFHSIIYNYSASKAFKLNRVIWSEDTIRSHVKLFLKHGWCKIENGHLVFLSKKELNETVKLVSCTEKVKDDYCNHYYKINCDLNYKEIRKHLYNALLTRKLRQMKFRRNKGFDKPQKTVHNDNLREGLQISFVRLKQLFGYKSISSIKSRMTEIELVTTSLTRRSFRPKRVFCEKIGTFVFRSRCSLYFLLEQNRSLNI